MVLIVITMVISRQSLFYVHLATKTLKNGGGHLPVFSITVNTGTLPSQEVITYFFKHNVQCLLTDEYLMKDLNWQYDDSKISGDLNTRDWLEEYRTSSIMPSIKP